MILEIFIPILVALSGIAVFVIKKILEKIISHRYDTALEEVRLEHQKEIEQLRQNSQREIEDIRHSYNIALEAVKSELSLALSKETTTDKLAAEQMAYILTKRTETCALLTSYCRAIMSRFAHLRVSFEDNPVDLTDETKKDKKELVKAALDAIEKLVNAFDDAISDSRMFITTSDIPIILTVKQLLSELRKADRQKYFNITYYEYLLLREEYATSVGIFTEQCYNPNIIDVPFVSILDLNLKRTLAERVARGEIQLRDNKREDE